MTRNRLSLMVTALAALALSACDQMPSLGKQSSAKTASSGTITQAAPAVSAQSVYAMDGQNCNGLAQKRMALFDRPDTHPASEQERKDALLALYSSCMRDHNWQVAGPVHTAPNVALASNSAASFAALSPAAGGNVVAPAGVTTNAANAVISSTSVPGATVVVIGGSKQANAAQLASLSPAAGGSASGQNATVVLVQQPQQPLQQQAYAAPAPASGYYPARVTPRTGPVAVPVATQAMNPPPVARAYQPAQTVASTTVTRGVVSPVTDTPGGLPKQGVYAPAHAIPSAPPENVYTGHTYNAPPPVTRTMTTTTTTVATQAPAAANQTANQQLETMLERK